MCMSWRCIKLMKLRTIALLCCALLAGDSLFIHRPRRLISIHGLCEGAGVRGTRGLGHESESQWTQTLPYDQETELSSFKRRLSHFLMSAWSIIYVWRGWHDDTFINATCKCSSKCFVLERIHPIRSRSTKGFSGFPLSMDGSAIILQVFKMRILQNILFLISGPFVNLSCDNRVSIFKTTGHFSMHKRALGASDFSP